MQGCVGRVTVGEPKARPTCVSCHNRVTNGAVKDHHASVSTSADVHAGDAITSRTDVASHV